MQPKTTGLSETTLRPKNDSRSWTRALFVSVLLAGGIIGLTSPLWVTNAEAKDPQPKDLRMVQEAEKKPASKGLRIIQEANGLPGQPQDEPSKQVVFMAKNALRLVDQVSHQNLLFRFEEGKPRIWQISADQSQYRDGADLQKIQADRDRWERQTIAHAKKEGEPEILKDLYIRPDGTRAVEITMSELTEKILGHTAKRYVVKENGRTIVDAKVTEEIDAPSPIFDFYRYAGAFSDEVLAKLQTIRGVPLEATITVVTASLNYKIHAKVREIKILDVIPEALFSLPEKAEEVKESKLHTCSICGLEFEKELAAMAPEIRGKKEYFDRRECFKEWKKQRKERLKD